MKLRVPARSLFKRTMPGRVNPTSGHFLCPQNGGAYGLHQHHFSRRFEGRLHVHLGYLSRKEQNAATWSQFVRDRAALDLEGKPALGANPDVFYYQVADPDQFGFYLMRLHIYGGLQVFVAFQPAGVADAAHFGTALIGAGVHTIFTLGDRTYEFNPGA